MKEKSKFYYEGFYNSGVGFSMKQNVQNDSTHFSRTRACTFSLSIQEKSIQRAFAYLQLFNSEHLCLLGIVWQKVFQITVWPIRFLNRSFSKTSNADHKRHHFLDPLHSVKRPQTKLCHSRDFRRTSYLCHHHRLPIRSSNVWLIRKHLIIYGVK